MNTAFSLPHQPRLLTLDELSGSDVHLFRSPKNNRSVQLVDVLGFALGLLYEFDPQVVGWIERPRTLALNDETHVELSFWLRYRDGREDYVLAVPAAQTQAAPNARRQHKRAKDLLEAAQKLGMRLTFVFEADIGARGGELATALRLLPYVLTARTLAHRHTVRDRICDVVGSSPGIRLSELKTSLEVFEPEDVQACAADLIHDGTITIDRQAPLSMHVVLSVGGAHENPR